MVFRYSKRARTFFTKFVPSRSFGGHVTWNSAVPDPNVWCCILLFLCTLGSTSIQVRPLFSASSWLDARLAWNVGKYQNGTSYTRVSARHNSDARAPLWVSFSKGFWAKNVLSPSGFSTFCGSSEKFLELSMASVSLPFSWPYIFTLLKILYLNRNHRR